LHGGESIALSPARRSGLSTVDLLSADQADRRIRWMDALRGMALLLVIIDHALQFVPWAGGSLPAIYNEATALFMPLRMPLMVFLSGMLLGPSLKKGAGPYFEGKARRLLWPYLVWSWAYVTMWIMVAPITGGAHSWMEYVTIFTTPPPGHMWFLYFLFLYYGICFATRRFNPLVVLVVAWAVATLEWVGHSSYLHMPLISYPTTSFELQKFCFLLPFFVSGHIFRRWLDRARVELPGAWFPVLGVVVYLFLSAALLHQSGDGRYRLAHVPIAYFGIAMMIMLAAWFGRSRWSEPMAYLGRFSLEVYVAHWGFTLATAMFLKRILGIDSGTVLVASSVIVGIACSLSSPRRAVERRSAGSSSFLGGGNFPGRARPRLPSVMIKKKNMPG